VFGGTASLRRACLATLVTAGLKVKTGTGASAPVWQQGRESMKAIIYAALCYRSRQVVIGPRQRRPCGMTEAFLPLPGYSLYLSMLRCTRTKYRNQMSRACEVYCISHDVFAKPHPCPFPPTLSPLDLSSNVGTFQPTPIMHLIISR
jgi:hypothetical protein